MTGGRATLSALAAALAVSVSACGDSPDYVGARERTLQAELSEFRITPQDHIAQRGELRLLVRNTGRLTHNLAVVSFERGLGTGEERELGRTPTAHPGETVSAMVRLKPGKYRLVCTLANNDKLGQYGELKVE